MKTIDEEFDVNELNGTHYINDDDICLFHMEDGILEIHYTRKTGVRTKDYIPSTVMKKVRYKLVKID